MTELFVDRRQIKIHFACKLRFELLDFQIDHHATAQTQVVEQQVEIKILVADIQTILAADKGELNRVLEKVVDQLADLVKQKLLVGLLTS
jgi:hypothetical protein